MVSVLKADEEPDKNSLQVIKAAWAIRDCAISEFLHDLTDHQEVPGRIAGQPQVVETGRNWVTISWPKPEIKDSTPVLAYKIEAWLVGAEGGAKWKELGVTPSNTLDAFNLQPGGEYLLRIRARNRYGWGEPLISDKPIVIGQLVDMPEIVKDMPALVRALDGTNVALTFFAKSATLPVFTWYKDGELLNFEKKPSEKYERTFDGRKVRLLIVSATADDAGHYVCEVKNEKGRVSSHGRLEVVADKKQWDAMEKLRNAADQESPDKPPEFAMHLRDRRVKVNFPVRLTCQATGFPEPKVQWFKDDERIFEDEKYAFFSGEQFFTLEIGSATVEDGGKYSARVYNEHGSVSCHCNLIVDKGLKAYVIPKFTHTLEPTVTVKEGGTLRLDAQVEAYPTVGISWRRDDLRLRPSRYNSMTLDVNGKVHLSIAGITMRDAGNYICTASNDVGNAETRTKVFVERSDTPRDPNAPPAMQEDLKVYSKEPKFLTKPLSAEAVEGDTVIIRCDVIGDPKPDVVWLRDWLKTEYYRDSCQFKRIGEGPGYRLEIPNVQLDHTGTYAIYACNPYGEVKAVISLQVFAKGQGKEGENGMDRSSIRHGPVQTAPIFIRRLKDIRCCDGDSVVFECAVRAEPRPEIRWEKDKKPLAYTEDFRVEHVGEIVKLHISKVYPEDEGVYACIAFNDGGKASTSAALTVDAPIDRDAILQKQLKLPGSPRSGSVTPKSPTPKIPSRSISPAVLKTREKSPSTLGTYSRLKQKRAQAPKFYAVPHNKVADEGETVRFQCAVAGHPAPYAFWDKDGERINSTPRIKVLERDDLRILEINDVNAMDAGLYRVRIENDFGGIDASARLEIISNKRRNSGGIRLTDTSSASPTFGRRLSGSAAREGSKFTFACDVQASPSPVTSWYRNGDPIESSERIVPSWDGKTARLELKQLRKGDSGVYQCIAENELGKTRCSAELVVVDSQDSSDADLKPPVFVSGLPASTHAIEGQPFELKIKLEGSEPMEVIWLKNGEEIPDCEDFRYKVYEGGSYGLLFADVFSPDSGVYSCTAYNSFGDAISTGKFIVRDEFSNGDTIEPQLQFVKSPNPVVAIAGGMATFCAKIKYMDKRLRPSLNWIVAGQDTNKNPQKFKVEEVGDTSVLHIAGVDTNDAGVVKCVATLGDDSCESLTELKVEQLEKYETPAILTQGPADISVLRGEKVVLTAAFVGRPDPFVRWLKAGRELSSDGHIEIVTKDGMSSLTISGINTDDSGKYVVSVENIHGADCHFASVAVEGSPDPPAKKPSVLANERSALITWSSPPFDGGCMITGYTIEMKTVKQRDWHVVTDRCHSLSHTVGELTPGESYIFRVRAENVHGLSEPSAESQVVQIKQTEDDLVAIYGTDTVKVENGEDFKDRFEVLEELGKGRFGIVHKVTDKTTGCKLAAKFVKCIKAKDKEKVWEEINIMNCLRHPKLLQLIAAFENSREVIMILEYISGGELFERVVADDFTLTERDCILFMRQICEGVDFMHQNCVVHLDLKPENIMCRTRTSHEIKLIDFGLARKIDPNVDERHLFGTPEFIPPEIINYEPIGVESDMWSVGVICYVLLSGLSPFMGDNDAETFANITRADFDFDDEAFDAISQDAKDFISALLVKRKEKRLTAKQCLEHKWMTQVDTEMSCVALSTDKLKKFIIRRKWQSMPQKFDRQTA